MEEKRFFLSSQNILSVCVCLCISLFGGKGWDQARKVKSIPVPSAADGRVAVAGGKDRRIAGEECADSRGGNVRVTAFYAGTASLPLHPTFCPPLSQPDSASIRVAVVAIDPLLDLVFEDADADWLLFLFEHMFLIMG